jgi:hypothetical protein
MKQTYLILIAAAVLFGCDKNETARLASQVDSLRTVIIQHDETSATLDEVGILLDSIDASRNNLSMDILDGITYADYITRLKHINLHIKQSQARITALETSLKKSKNVSASTIKRLRANLDAKSAELVEFQIQIAELRQNNDSQYMRLLKKDSIISSKDEIIQIKGESVAALQTLVQDIDEQNRIKVGNLYFDQAQALETAADRTQFAPRRKKDTRREALELYRLSLSMGNLNAQEKIDNLEKQLS